MTERTYVTVPFHAFHGPPEDPVKLLAIRRVAERLYEDMRPQLNLPPWEDYGYEERQKWIAWVRRRLEWEVEREREFMKSVIGSER
jgi:hypothetical protein